MTKYSKEAETYNDNGSALDDQKKYDEAIEYYDKAIEIEPCFVKAYNNKGITLNK